jgi:hypothetical protein
MGFWPNPVAKEERVEMLEGKWQDANSQLEDDVFNNSMDYVNGGIFDFIDVIPRKRIYSLILTRIGMTLFEIKNQINSLVKRYEN